MWMAMARQMRAGLLQSWHLPSAAQGVLAPSRLAFSGAATLRARSTALARSGHSLLTPHTKMHCLGPNSVAETRLPVPSMLTISPVSLSALAEER